MKLEAVYNRDKIAKRASIRQLTQSQNFFIEKSELPNVKNTTGI